MFLKLWERNKRNHSSLILSLSLFFPLLSSAFFFLLWLSRFPTLHVQHCSSIKSKGIAHTVNQRRLMGYHLSVGFCFFVEAFAPPSFDLRKKLPRMSIFTSDWVIICFSENKVLHIWIILWGFGGKKVKIK